MKNDNASIGLTADKSFKTVDVVEFKAGDMRAKNISIAEEIPLTIYLNEKEIVTLLCTNTDIYELVIGFLASEGFISGFKDIKSIEINKKKGIALAATKSEKKIAEKLFLKRLIATGCGRGTSFYNFLDPVNIKKISFKKNNINILNKEVLLLMDDFLKLGIGYKETTATHSAALANKDGITVFKEDIGRHNALDKLLGFSIKNNIKTEDMYLLTTGRITSEMLIKAAKIGTAIVISRSSPSILALTLANDLGVTIIGRVIKDRFFVYSESYRVL